MGLAKSVSRLEEGARGINFAIVNKEKRRDYTAEGVQNLPAMSI